MGMDSSQCNEELILEGSKMDASKTNSIVQKVTLQNIPLMLVKMEIKSIEDFKVQRESQNNSEGEVN